jgi:hypothetical protein
MIFGNGPLLIHDIYWFLYWSVRYFTCRCVCLAYPKVIVGEKWKFHVVVWEFCDLGVLVLCFGWLGERSSLISLSSLMAPIKWKGRTKDVVQVLLQARTALFDCMPAVNWVRTKYLLHLFTCYYMNDLIHATSPWYYVPMLLATETLTTNSSGENWNFIAAFYFCLLFSLQLLLIKICYFENIKSHLLLRVTSQFLKSYWYSRAPIVLNYKFGLHFWIEISAIPYTCGLSSISMILLVLFLPSKLMKKRSFALIVL